MNNKKYEMSTLLLVVLLLCIVFVPAINAQENSANSNNNTSKFEQGLINALNTKTKESSTDSVITNYLKENKIKSQAEKCS
jgi:hypothetical protein